MTKNQELYAWYKSMGICPQCGCNRAAPHRVRCEECLAKCAESTAKRISKLTKEEAEKRREQDKKRTQQRRQQRVANGLCIWCGKPVCSTSKVFCIDCKIKNQRKNDKRKMSIDRCERPAYGLCYRCGKPLDREGKLCKHCAEQSVANLAKADCTEQKEYFKAQNKLIFRN